MDEIGKSKMPCRFCDGTGINDWDKQKTITVFGKDLQEIREILELQTTLNQDALNFISKKNLAEEFFTYHKEAEASRSNK